VRKVTDRELSRLERLPQAAAEHGVIRTYLEWIATLPWGTFTVNVVGSFVLGVVASSVTLAGTPEWVLSLVGTGICGALTTFSTFCFETVRLVEDGSWLAAVVNTALSLVLGFTACAAGWWVVTVLV